VSAAAELICVEIRGGGASHQTRTWTYISHSDLETTRSLTHTHTHTHTHTRRRCTGVISTPQRVSLYTSNLPSLIKSMRKDIINIRIYLNNGVKPRVKPSGFMYIYVADPYLTFFLSFDTIKTRASSPPSLSLPLSLSPSPLWKKLLTSAAQTSGEVMRALMAPCLVIYG